MPTHISGQPGYTDGAALQALVLHAGHPAKEGYGRTCSTLNRQALGHIQGPCWHWQVSFVSRCACGKQQDKACSQVCHSSIPYMLHDSSELTHAVLQGSTHLDVCRVAALKRTITQKVLSRARGQGQAQAPKMLTAVRQRKTQQAPKMVQQQLKVARAQVCVKVMGVRSDWMALSSAIRGSCHSPVCLPVPNQCFIFGQYYSLSTGCS